MTDRRLIDDWLIILPLLLSIALIGPSYKRKSSVEHHSPPQSPTNVA